MNTEQEQVKQTMEDFTKELQQLMDKHKVVVTPYCCDCCCQSLSVQVVATVPTVKVHEKVWFAKGRDLNISLVTDDRQPNVSIEVSGKARIYYKPTE